MTPHIHSNARVNNICSESYPLSLVRLTLRRARPEDLARVLNHYTYEPSPFNCPRHSSAFAASIDAGQFLIVETDEREIVFASGVFADPGGRWLEFGATKAAKSRGSGMRLQRLVNAAKSVLTAGEGHDMSRIWCSCLPHNSPSLRNIEASGFKVWTNPDPRLSTVYRDDRPTPVFYRYDPQSLLSQRAYVAGVASRGYVERRVRETPLGPIVQIEYVPMHLLLDDEGDRIGRIETTG